MQVKLLNRSTRSIGLTEAGRIYYQGCRRMLHEVQDVHEQLYAFNNTTIGTMRIGCSSSMAQNVLAGLTANMLKDYPGLSVNLVTGIPAPDLIADGLDVVLRVGALHDSSLFSRRLGAMPMVVCAAKSYLTQYGIPEKPADLSSHSWLEYSVRSCPRPDCRRAGCGAPRRRVARFQPVFPPSGRDANGGVRRKKLSHTIRHTRKTRRFK